MSRAALLLVVAACVDRPARNGSPALTPGRDSADSAFALVQTRGHVAMGVDQYTSSHRFESLPDGGRISLQRDPGDSAGVAQIRSHMRRIAAAFARGDYALPGLRLRTSDPSAVAAIHQFLAFQRQDHRSTSAGAGH